jgi:hypothetical protein
MNTLPTTAHQQRNTIFSLVAFSMIVLFSLQLWLFIEVLHGSLGSEGGYSLLATLVSLLCVAGNWQLWHLLHRRIDNFSR